MGFEIRQLLVFRGHRLLMAAFCVIMVLIFSGGFAVNGGSLGHDDFNLYFSSPEEAVPIISRLLKNEDFAHLSRYYDLSGSEVDRNDLESGIFFIAGEQPDLAHPGGFWRYKHPFSPGFSYNGMQSTGHDGVFLIEMVIAIDQGEGMPVQRGFTTFSMIKSERGWQILPDF